MVNRTTIPTCEVYNSSLQWPAGFSCLLLPEEVGLKIEGPYDGGLCCSIEQK